MPLPELAAEIAAKIADYRQGEIPQPDAAHVLQWISQFSPEVREPLLTETLHVIGKTYFDRAKVIAFLNMLISSPNVTEGNPAEFWSRAQILDIQTAGQSQHEMTRMFDGLLREHFAFGIDARRQNPSAYVYIDDGLFTGIRILRDLTQWIQRHAPDGAHIHIVVIAGHRGGQHYANTELKKVANASGKQIQLHWWASIILEDRKYYINDSDVLRPSALPNDPASQAYAAALGYPIVFRTAASIGGKQIFSSVAGRELLEQELLKAGVAIRQMAPLLPVAHRPLGNTALKMLGFGSTIVTFRNCPNNAPLAFWAGQPWYPLFRRRIN